MMKLLVHNLVKTVYLMTKTLLSNFLFAIVRGRRIIFLLSWSIPLVTQSSSECRLIIFLFHWLWINSSLLFGFVSMDNMGFLVWKNIWNLRNWIVDFYCRKFRFLVKLSFWFPSMTLDFLASVVSDFDKVEFLISDFNNIGFLVSLHFW